MSGAEDSPGKGSVTLARVFEFLQEMREQQRRDGRQIERLTDMMLGLTDQVRRLDRHVGDVDRRLSEQKDDMELMLKAELMGQLGMLRAEMDRRFDELADRITVLEGGDPWRLEGGSGPRR